MVLQNPESNPMGAPRTVRGFFLFFPCLQSGLIQTGENLLIRCVVLDP